MVSNQHTHTHTHLHMTHMITAASRSHQAHPSFTTNDISQHSLIRIVCVSVCFSI